MEEDRGQGEGLVYKSGTRQGPVFGRCKSHGCRFRVRGASVPRGRWPKVERKIGLVCEKTGSREVRVLYRDDLCVEYVKTEM